jgi:hypothetical protein
MAPPGSLNRMIDAINKMFPDMKLNISRPGGTQLNAIVEIHLERILKVSVANNLFSPNMKLNISRPGGTQLNAIVEISDVNVHKTNSFFGPIFQFVSISKRSSSFYSYITMIESKIRPNSFNNSKEITKTKTKRNECSIQSKKTSCFRD